MIFKEFKINSKVYYFSKFIITLLLILIIYNYYFNFEYFSSNFEVDENIKSVFNENNLIIGDLVVTQSFNMVPKGSIVAWNSSTDKPKGWAICDGKNDTPDLRGRFIVGSGHGNNLSKREIGDIGGEENHLLVENEIPEHGHSINTYSGIEVLHEVMLNGPDCKWPLIDGSSPYFTTLYPNNEKDMEFETQEHNNMPPYFILYYIMKL